MRLSDNGLKLIQAWEGLGDGNPQTVILEPYCDMAGVWTVGYGTALTTPTGQLADRDVFGAAKAKQLAMECMQRRFGKLAITREEATALLLHDVQKYEAAVNKVVDPATAQCEFDAMVALCFNIGIGGFLGSSVARFHKAGARKVGNVSLSGLKAQSQANARPINIQIAFTSWVKANKRWTLGLFRRRLCELLVYGGHPLATALSTSQSVR